MTSLLKSFTDKCMEPLYVTMPRASGRTAAKLAVDSFMKYVHQRTIDYCAISADVMDSMYGVATAHIDDLIEPSLSELLKEIEEKEDDDMVTLQGKRIKRVVIECEDGSTFEGEIKRIEGCPYDYRSMMVEAKVGTAVGRYGIKEVIFANPTTKVKWTDGTETVVTCQDNVKIIKKTVDGKTVMKRKPMKSETYSKEVGLAMCIAKKWGGNRGNFNNIFRQYIEGYTEGKA